MDVRALLVATFAVLALTGLAMAADAQLETFLKPEEITTGFDERSAVQGNLVALTGLITAAAISVIGAVMAKVRIRQRILPVITLFVSTYALLLILQTAMFNYFVNGLARNASFSVSTFLFNGTAAPSVYIGPMAVVVAAALGISLAGSRLLGTTRQMATPARALSAYMAAFSLSVPFLAVLVWGGLQVIMALPDEEPGTLAYLLVMPLLVLAALGLLVIGLVKMWQLGMAVRDGQAGLAAHDAWIALYRAEWAAMLVLAAASLAAAGLQPLDLPIFAAGRVFEMTARSHAEASIFVLITLMPALAMQNQVLRLLRAESTLEGRQTAPSLPISAAYVAVVCLGFLGAGLATWMLDGVLWAWVFVALPVAVFGLVALQPADGLLPALVAGTLLWAIGNTVTGAFELVSQTGVVYSVSPGLLALWRAAAVLLVAWAVARAARDKIGTMGRTLAWPLTAGLGAAVALILFLELPFSAWVIYENGAEFVGIGTVVASQDPPVRVVIHILTGTAAFFTGIAVSRLHRPEWFARKPNPMPALTPAPDGQA